MKPLIMMKFVALVAILTFAVAAFAAVPGTINYQGYLKNSDGTPVNVATNVTFRLYSSAASPASSALWTEADRITPVNGVYSLELGSLTPFGTLAFDRPYFLGITVGRDLTEMAPRQPLTSVPYAFRTATSDSVVNGLYSTGAYSDPEWLLSLAGSKITGTVASATSALNATNAVNAANVTNGVYTTGSYADPSWLTSLAGSKISGAVATATTAGNSSTVTNGLYSTGTYYNPSWLASLAGNKISSTVGSALNADNATTVTNGLYSTGSYSNPVWITSLAGSKISGTVPSAISATSVTNGVYTTGSYADPPWITSLAGSKVVGSISVAGQVESTGSGFKFPDATIQTTAAAPTWSQILPVATRFELVMGNVAVLDKETGLVWQRSTNSTGLVWDQAIYYCNSLKLGGRMGWRLPSIQELTSLIDPSQYNPALPAGHPFINVASGTTRYYTSTVDPMASSYVYTVYFIDGAVEAYGKDIPDFVRCVRGSQ